MQERDSLQSFIFEHANIRGNIGHLDSTFDTILTQRAYPHFIKQLLAEAMVSSLLLTGTIKFEGDLSLQFQGDERLPLLLVQTDHNLHMRAFAKYKDNLTDEAYAAAFLKGQLALTINQYNKTNTYQSIVPVKSVAMSENLMHYFAQSEQISTHIWIAVNETHAAGLLLQLLPGQPVQAREEFWEYAIHIGQTITNNELLNLPNSVLLHRLYHETDLRLFDSRPVSFYCRCSAEKMQQVLKVLGEKEIQTLLTDKGQIEIACEFCNRHYTWDPIDITMLFRT